MRLRLWEAVASVLFLIICLAGGLALAERYAPRPIIGVVRFEGLIDPISARQMTAILDATRHDERVVGVMMEISSPGGDMGSIEKLYHAMLQVRQEKPLVVAVDSIALSGGYYLAVAGNKVYAPASAYVGNVGVRTFRPLDPEISPDSLTSGPYKLSGGSRFDTVRQLELMKQAFVGNVVHQRSHSPYNKLQLDEDALAEAHIYLGSEALALGLVDAQGSRSDAILDAAELAGVRDYEILELSGYLGLPFEPRYDFAALINDALPGTVFLLDSRIPLDGRLPEELSRQSLYQPEGGDPMPAWEKSDPSAPVDRPGGTR